jgi:imidazolonepropionase-like amidohydrolase
MNKLNFVFPHRTGMPLAITHVTVIPMDTKRQLHDQTVVVEDGRIKSIGPAGNFNTNAMAVVDGTGKYLLPGLADMHVHYWMPGDATLFLSHGVTLVRNMSGAPYHLALKQKVERGELPGPRIVTTSPILDGDEYMLPMWKSLREPQEAKSLVEKYAARGYQQIKVLNQISHGTLRVLGNACKENGLRLTGHCPLIATYEEAIQLGMTSFEHLVGIWRGHFVSGVSPKGNTNLSLDVVEAVAHHMDFEAIRRLAGHMAEQEIWNCPTLVTEQFMQLPYAEGMVNPEIRPWLKYMPQSAFPLWEILDSNRRYAKEPEMLTRWRNAIRGRAEALAKVVGILHEEGAPLLIGTDTSVRFVIQGVSLHQEIENFVQAGIPPFEALRSATSEPSRFLGKAHEFGTITEGKRADLILIKENPLEDVSVLRNPIGVFVNGYYLSRDALDGLLDTQEKLAVCPPWDILPAIFLGDSLREGKLIGNENWIEYSGELPKGRLSYRHWQLPDGSWKIEEQYAFEQNSIFDMGGRRLRTTNLILNSDLTVRSGTAIEESFAGISRIEFSTETDDLFYVKQTGEDGFVEEYKFVGRNLLPDISLSLTLPALKPFRAILGVKNEHRVICLLAGVEFERVQAGCLTIELTPLPENTYSEWKIRSERQEHKTEGAYRISDGDQFMSCVYNWNRFVPERHTPRQI